MSLAMHAAETKAADGPPLSDNMPSLPYPPSPPMPMQSSPSSPPLPSISSRACQTAKQCDQCSDESGEPGYCAIQQFGATECHSARRNPLAFEQCKAQNTKLPFISSATPAKGPADNSDGDNPLVSMWKAYNSKLESDPLIMKMLTSFTGFLLGDIIAQTCITKGDFDWFRLFRLSSFGFFVHGSTSHYFYNFLDGKIPGTTAAAVASKVFIDQVIWNPIFGVMFFGYVAALECKGLPFVVEKIKKELWTQVTGSWKVWPIAHTINFRFIPSSQRVLYINSIQIGYNCFLSVISSRD